MVRQKRSPQKLDLLAAAAHNDPVNAQCLLLCGCVKRCRREGGAIQALGNTIKAHPYDRDSLAAPVTFSEQAGDRAKALS